MNPTPAAQAQPDTRWTFMRDVLVLQFKLVLGNLQNFLLVPITLGAALLDLFFKRHGRDGARFYSVLEVGRQIDESINLYGAIGGYHATGIAAAAPADGASPEPGSKPARAGAATVDLVVRRVEDVIVREYRRGGTAASVKAAVDRVLDELQRERKP